MEKKSELARARAIRASPATCRAWTRARRVNGEATKWSAERSGGPPGPSKTFHPTPTAHGGDCTAVDGNGILTPPAESEGYGIDATRGSARSGDHDLVAHASHGEDPLGRRRVGLDPAPEPLDVHVEGLGVAHVVVAPDLVDELVPGDHPARPLEQQLQDLELLEGQVQRLAAERDLVAIGVEDEVAGRQRPRRRCPAPGRASARPPGAARPASGPPAPAVGTAWSRSRRRRPRGRRRCRPRSPWP